MPNNQNADDLTEQVIEFMEYLDSLSESEAEQIISELDEETVELIDQVLSEGKTGKALAAAGLIGLGAYAGPKISSAIDSGVQKIKNVAAALGGSSSDQDRVSDDGTKLYIPKKKEAAFSPGRVSDNGTKLYIPNSYAHDMTFRDFLMEKQIINFVNHLDTLSESEAQEILSQLDEETLEFIEMVINEGVGETLKKFGKKALPYVAGAGIALGGMKMMSSKSASGPVKTQKTHQTSGQGVSSDPSDE
jgi:hypothetical protein